METLLPPVSVDRALAFDIPIIVVVQGSSPQADQALVDATVEGVYRDDPLPPDLEDELANEVATRGS